MENNGYSLSDLAAITKNSNGEGGWAWLFLIIVLLAAGGRGWGSAPQVGQMVPPNVATQGDVQAAVNNQTVNSGLQQILLSSANNNYEAAQLITGQTNSLMQQNNTNQVNMIQGFNAVTNQLMQQTNAIANKLDGLQAHMDSCCCDMKMTVMQNQLDDANRKLADAQNKNNIAAQTQTILANLGRFVAWEGTGTATSSAIGV